MKTSRGFSLAELLVAIAITAGLGAAVFGLLVQNKRVFNDYGVIAEMQQSARTAAAQIASDLRLAGQGVPLYAAGGDAIPVEEITVLLPESSATRAAFRSGFSNAESRVTGPLPLEIRSGIPGSFVVERPAELSRVTGPDPSGRYAYIWGVSDGHWNWVRARLQSVTAAGLVTVTPTVRNEVVDQPVRFTAAPAIAVEEAVVLFFDSATASIRRAAAIGMDDPNNPSWGPAHEIAANVVSLTFEYYDRAGVAILPDAMKSRAAVARIGFRLVLRTAQTLSNGSGREFALAVQTAVRNRPLE